MAGGEKKEAQRTRGEKNKKDGCRLTAAALSCRCHSLRSVAGSRPGIRKRPARHRNEPPIIAVAMQRQLQHAVRVRVSHFAIRLVAQHPPQGRSSCADDELANAARCIRLALRILWSKSLVVVIVTVHHDVGIRVIERLPKILHFLPIPVEAGTEPRMMEVRQRAGYGMRCQVLP